MAEQLPEDSSWPEAMATLDRLKVEHERMAPGGDVWVQFDADDGDTVHVRSERTETGWAELEIRRAAPGETL